MDHDTPQDQPLDSPSGACYPDAQSPIEHVLAGYRCGAFPMTIAQSPDQEPVLGWYEADTRGVIRLDSAEQHIPRRLRQMMRQKPFEITSDTAFGMVINACSDPRREGGWIDAQIISIFHTFVQIGLAHSIEAWLDASRCPDLETARADGLLDELSDTPRVLVGGLYGLCVGTVFCGESMFSRPDLGGSNASKICLAHMLEHLVEQGFMLLDTQLHTDHLAQFGCQNISRDTYLELLNKYRDTPCPWGRFTPD